MAAMVTGGGGAVSSVLAEAPLTAAVDTRGSLPMSSSESLPPPAPFLSLAYGYLPLCWAATLVGGDGWVSWVGWMVTGLVFVCSCPPN